MVDAGSFGDTRRVRDIICARSVVAVMGEEKEDRMSYALDQALHNKPARKMLTNNEMLHQIFSRFDKDVDFRLNDKEFIDFLKALDPNWKEHIVDIAWEVRGTCLSRYSSCPFSFVPSCSSSEQAHKDWRRCRTREHAHRRGEEIACTVSPRCCGKLWNLPALTMSVSSLLPFLPGRFLAGQGEGSCGRPWTHGRGFQKTVHSHAGVQG